MNNGAQLEKIGAIVSTVGTTLSAISSTPNLNIPQTILDDFDFIGNILEAVGATISITNEQSTAIQLGEILSILGNIEVAATSFLSDERAKAFYSNQGTLLQILGGTLDLPFGQRLTMEETLNTLGQILDLIGNVMQLLADQRSEAGIVWNAVGGWIQVIGAVLGLLSMESKN